MKVGRYSHRPLCGALYVGSWSIHWTLNGPVKVGEKGQVFTARERPRRVIVMFRDVLYEVVAVPLWRHRGFCDHGFYRGAWWHNCAYVSAENPDGRPSDRELWPEDYAEASERGRP